LGLGAESVRVVCEGAAGGRDGGPGEAWGELPACEPEAAGSTERVRWRWRKRNTGWDIQVQVG